MLLQGKKQSRNNKSYSLKRIYRKKNPVETVDPLLDRHVKCSYSDKNMEKEAQERTSSRYFFWGSRFKSKVDFQTDRRNMFC